MALEGWRLCNPAPRDVIGTVRDRPVRRMRLIKCEAIRSDHRRLEAGTIDRNHNAAIDDVRLKLAGSDGRVRGDICRGDVTPSDNVGRIRRACGAAHAPTVAYDSAVVRLSKAIPGARDRLRQCLQCGRRAITATLPATHVKIGAQFCGGHVSWVPNACRSNYRRARIDVDTLCGYGGAVTCAIEGEDASAIVLSMGQREPRELH